MSSYVDGYIEAPAGSGTPAKYLAFVSSDPHAGAINLAGPFPSPGKAQAWADSYNRNPAHQAGSDIPHGGLPDPAASLAAPGQIAGKAFSGLTGVNAIGDFFQRLGQANTWIRAAEVLLGLALLSVGFGKITGTTPVVEKALKGAGKVIR